ncbi:hypothetical protein DRP07_00780 [Archaeoglobales archaeon]|nr:MAG: hypothetical protein DRP07_00780 [Archaeoglobales archaeon]
MTSKSNWTDWQLNYLKENYGKKSIAKIAKQLRKTEWQVVYMARKLKLTQTRRNGGMKPIHLMKILEEAEKRGLIK